MDSLERHPDRFADVPKRHLVRVELTHQIHRHRSAHDRLGDDAGVSQRLLGLGDRTTLQQVLFGVGCCQTVA